MIIGIKQNLKDIFFYIFMFLLGLTAPISVGVSKGWYFFGIVILTIRYRKTIRNIIARHKIYFWGLQIFSGYILLLILFGVIFINNTFTPSFSDIEMMLTFYSALPLFILLATHNIDVDSIKKSLALFCVGITINGFFVLFYLYGFKNILTHPIGEFIDITNSRFTMWRLVLGKFIFIKDYSLYFGISALITFYLWVIFSKLSIRILLFFLFVVNVIFLLLCVTRGSIVGFIFGMLPLLYWFLKKRSIYKRIIYLGIILIILFVIIYNLPATITHRFLEIPTESTAFLEKNDGSGSVSTRLTIWKIIFSHVKEFWLFGNNPLYTHQILTKYFLEAGRSDYVASGYMAHNVYLDCWLRGGIVDLFLLFFTLLYPIVVMIKKKQPVYFGMAIAIFLCTVGMEDHYYVGRHMPAMLLSLLFLSVFIFDKLLELENPKNMLYETNKIS